MRHYLNLLSILVRAHDVKERKEHSQEKFNALELQNESEHTKIPDVQKSFVTAKFVFLTVVLIHHN